VDFAQSLLQGFSTLATGPIALALLMGAILGIVVGVLPGVGPGVTIAVLLPFTYGMAPLAGISLLLGVYCGAFYGGAVTSILIRTPGEASSMATRWPKKAKHNVRFHWHLCQLLSAVL
jgi:putative tricarboxylic transport membrane protein